MGFKIEKYDNVKSVYNVKSGMICPPWPALLRRLPGEHHDDKTIYVYDGTVDGVEYRQGRAVGTGTSAPSAPAAPALPEKLQEEAETFGEELDDDLPPTTDEVRARIRNYKRKDQLKNFLATETGIVLGDEIEEMRMPDIYEYAERLLDEQGL